MPNKKILDRRFYPAETLVIEEGTQGDCAYYIESGTVEVFTTDSNGNEICLSTICTEDIFGEMALITQDKRTASVRTLEDSTLITILPKDFKLAYSSSDKIFRKLLNTLVQRLVEANHFIASQHKTISDLEETTNQTINNISYSLPEELRGGFQTEILPILEHLQATLKKYNELNLSKLIIPADEPRKDG